MPSPNLEPSVNHFLSDFAQRQIRKAESVPGVPELVKQAGQVIDLIRRGPTRTETGQSNTWSCVASDRRLELTMWKPSACPQDGLANLTIWPASSDMREATSTCFYADPQGKLLGLDSIHLPDQRDSQDTAPDQPVSITEAQQRALMGDRITEAAASQVKQQIAGLQAAFASDSGVIFEVLFRSEPPSET